jgi:hypothetical protein
MVPVFVIELDETRAALRKTTREQAVRGEGAIARLAAVKLQRLRAFLAHVHQIRHAGLHLEGHLILRDACGDLWIIHECVVLLVECVDGRHIGSLAITRDAVRVREIQHGIAFGAKLHALILRRQKTAAPLPRGDGLVLPTLAQRCEYHEARQIRRLSAESISDP